jgi:hypothetical protein
VTTLNSKDYVPLAERDALVVDALSTALRAMRLFNGNTVELSGERHQLRLENPMLKIHEALVRLGVDWNEIL